LTHTNSSFWEDPSQTGRPERTDPSRIPARWPGIRPFWPNPGQEGRIRPGSQPIWLESGTVPLESGNGSWTPSDSDIIFQIPVSTSIEI
jgi:hypothetical protein